MAIIARRGDRGSSAHALERRTRRLDQTSPGRSLAQSHDFAHPLVGEIGPLAEQHLKGIVATGPLDELGEARLGKARLGIAGDRVQHDLVAAQHEDVADGLVQEGALADGQHVIAALRKRDRDEILVGQPGETFEDRPRDHDLVLCERADDTFRRVRDVREPLRELRSGRNLGCGREPGYDDIEQADLFVVQLLGLAHEQIGDAAHGLGAPAGLAAGDAVFEVED